MPCEVGGHVYFLRCCSSFVLVLQKETNDHTLFINT